MTLPSPRLPPPPPQFAPGLRALQMHLVDKGSNERDPFIARGLGQPQWMGGYEALDGVFVFTSQGNTRTQLSTCGDDDDDEQQQQQCDDEPAVSSSCPGTVPALSFEFCISCF